MGTITLPIWFVILAAILALFGLIDRLLAPSVRWFFRRRANKAIEKLNSKLSLKIQPFKLTKREGLIDALMFDPEVIKAIENQAKESGSTREVIMEKARSYAHEVVPAFSHYTYFKIGTRLARSVSKMLYRVRLGNPDEAALKEIDENSSVVFVMNHRSNMDYVLVTYMAATSSALSYAVGEWAQIWGLQSLIRAMGAYFVRRQSTGNALYRKVLARYVHMATEAGVTQAIFPEGGLSMDGKLRPPKFGLLSYMVSDFDPNSDKDIVFVPVGLNYDRVLEDRMLSSNAKRKQGEKPKFRFSPKILLGFIGHSIALAFKGQWFRNGYACVSFGKPVSMRKYLSSRGTKNSLSGVSASKKSEATNGGKNKEGNQQDYKIEKEQTAGVSGSGALATNGDKNKDDKNKRAFDLRLMSEEQRFEEIEKLGQSLMQEVGKAVPVLPVSLVATIFVQEGARPLSLFEVKQKTFNLITKLEESGAHIHVPRNDHDYLIDVGLRMLTLRHIVKKEDDKYRANWQETDLLNYYANSIVHLL
ncbi:MAG: 1-acyl-sn-glycerol-3-phosphate acyltransferase [Devosiaceae bacterium]|nr:1-acyl-sn-glycerol-3-phosphate acyltransferase [Devosiaceae bacterium]